MFRFFHTGNYLTQTIKTDYGTTILFLLKILSQQLILTTLIEIFLQQGEITVLEELL